MKKGIPSSKGYAIGYVYLKKDEEIDLNEKKFTSIEEEIQRLNESVEKSKYQLEEIKKKAEESIGKSGAEIFSAHIMLLEDEEFIGAMKKIIEDEKVIAEQSVDKAANTFAEMFSLMDDSYMKERAADIRDIGKRLIKNLSGKEDDAAEFKENTVIVAHDLTPSDTAQLDKEKVCAFLTDIGGFTSHSSILARTLEIPCVVGMNDITTSVKTGDKIIVDGTEGIAIINPDEETLKKYEKLKEEYENEKLKLRRLINVDAVTKSGKRVIVAGNIGSPKDVDKVLEVGGEGIGLFRTEFLFMGKDDFPTEQEQFEAYKYVASKMGDRQVVIRTLDIGGDKSLPYLDMPKELNPFLGYRAIRLCLDNKPLFKTQLRAILRASAFGKIGIMFPMISGLEEFLKAKEILQECKEELRKENINFDDNIEVGIMVEIPSAALAAEELAKHVDFFSIGTNDLIQYTIAVDRMNEKVSYLYNPMHPAVLRLIEMTINAAHKEGKWCGMCGEMAGDERAIPKLLELGLDEFSMSPSSILRAKEIIINW
ncbi:phosphoenolpyruvate--protein phosphotransferase [Caloramator quimbayensis]|uniref:Phosphoenolpyruvate-protein phosphotransferase n=1 Tax=Caloramator quimbayensis TaxID=1147123 RepID=A0A1T4YAM2_9CLOT|nr:phosphoenolpyruvate--protein phosphotransferase [Caloramator quimbayensis]SKA98743.1 phosphoenolpyruvate--protein phosphotransferase [Caloramator quimbayensis]